MKFRQVLAYGLLMKKQTTDKEDMTKHAREHIANSVATMREIWGNAEPELRKQMKADLQALIGEMTT